MSALLNCPIYDREDFESLVRDDKFWTVMEELVTMAEKQKPSSAGEAKLAEQVVRLLNKLLRNKTELPAEGLKIIERVQKNAP